MQCGDAKVDVEILLKDAFEPSWSPLFWHRCFVRLFPRGDCMERCPERCARVPARLWAKCLLKRADFQLWSSDVEFVVTLCKVFLRWDQINAVEAEMRSQYMRSGEVEALAELTAVDLMSVALASGVREQRQGGSEEEKLTA